MPTASLKDIPKRVDSNIKQRHIDLKPITLNVNYYLSDESGQNETPAADVTCEFLLSMTDNTPLFFGTCIMVMIMRSFASCSFLKSFNFKPDKRRRRMKFGFSSRENALRFETQISVWIAELFKDTDSYFSLLIDNVTNVKGTKIVRTLNLTVTPSLKTHQIFASTCDNHVPNLKCKKDISFVEIEMISPLYTKDFKQIETNMIKLQTRIDVWHAEQYVKYWSTKHHAALGEFGVLEGAQKHTNNEEIFEKMASQNAAGVSIIAPNDIFSALTQAVNASSILKRTYYIDENTTFVIMPNPAGEREIRVGICDSPKISGDLDIGLFNDYADLIIEELSLVEQIDRYPQVRRCPHTDHANCSQFCSAQIKDSYKGDKPPLPFSAFKYCMSGHTA